MTTDMYWKCDKRCQKKLVLAPIAPGLYVGKIFNLKLQRQFFRPSTLLRLELHDYTVSLLKSPE